MARDLSSGEIVRLLRFLRRTLEPFGLDEQGKSRSRHSSAGLTIASRLEAAEREATQSKSSSGLSKECVTMAALAQSVEGLVKAQVPELDSRFVQLTKNWQEFESYAYELKVANAYVESGAKVAFAKERGMEGLLSHDFDVEGQQTFHVECKRLEPESPPKVQHEAVIEELTKAVLDRPGFREVHQLVLDTDRLLVPGDVERLRDFIVRAIDEGTVGTIQSTDGERLAFVKQGENPPQNPMSYKVGSDILELDFITGSAGQRGFMVRCPSVPDRTRNALLLIRTACDQLPVSGPGIVWLSVSGMTKLGLGGGLTQIKERIALRLARHPHVSTCVVSHEDVYQHPGGRFLSHQYWVVGNPAAKWKATPDMTPGFKSSNATGR